MSCGILQYGFSPEIFLSFKIYKLISKIYYFLFYFIILLIFIIFIYFYVFIFM